jgi:PAS domain S-box-containing protein
LIDAQGQVLYASPSAARILGYPQGELSGPATRLIHPEDRAAAEGTLAQVVGAPGQPIGQTYRVRHGDGTWRWVEGTATNLLADSAVGGIVVNFRDITKRKQVETALRENAERLRLAHKATNDVVWDWDVVQDTQQWSEAGTTVFGWTDIVAAPQSADWWVSRVYPDDRQRVEQGFFAVVDDPAKTSWHDEYRFRKADGSYAQVLDRGYVLRNAAGQALRMIGAMLDITARKEAEQALRESEEKYRGLMESLDSVVATVDQSGRFLYMNDVAAQQLGGAAQKFIGKTMHELFPEPVASAQLADIRLAIDADRGTVQENLSIVGGQPRWHRTTIQPIHDAHGQVAYVLITSTDIHELKTTQQELLALNRTLEERVRERTAQVQDLYDNAPMGYHSLDAAGNLVMINQTELDWLGYTREEVLGQPILSFLSPASRAVFETYFPKLKQSGVVRDAEIELVRKDGTRFLALLNSSAIYDARGNFVMSRSSLLDITARKQAEDALRESEAQNRLMFDAAPDATALFDAEGRLIRVNAAFERLTGYRAAQVHGRMFAELALLSREQIAQQSQATQEAFKSSHIAAIEFQIRRADGAPRDVSVHMFGLTIGGRQHYIATARDITVEKQAAETLRRALGQERELNELKSRFISMTSHEFRTPLTVIFSSTEMLELYGAHWPEEKKRVHYGRMKTAVQNMTRMLEDILILGRAEAGRLTFSPAPLDLTEFCRGLVEELQLSAGARHTLEFVSAGACGPARMDEKLLRQILGNLLSNAIKYSPADGRSKPSVRLALNCADGWATFAVQDHGIGIPADAQPRLFESFHRAHNVGAIPGTGLGLAIVKRSVELHGGTITCASQEGQGATFTVTLPLGRHEAD